MSYRARFGYRLRAHVFPLRSSLYFLGTYISTWGQRVCLLCDTGEYCDHEGCTTCSKCSPGSYQSLPGQEVRMPHFADVGLSLAG